MLIRTGSQAYDRRVDGLPPVECHNAYPERTPTEIGTDWILTQVPGERLFSGLPKSTDRGMFASYGVFDGDIFTLVGDSLYRTDSAGVSTELANGIGGTDKAVFTSVRGFVVFTANEQAWVYDGTAVAQITDPDLPAVTSVAAMDGRILFMEKDSDRVWWSGIFDPTNIDALAFATAETFEDQLVRLIADHRELWLFGQTTIEIWRPVADAEQPFQRIGDMVLQKGTLSPQSVVQMDNTLYWVGQDAMVYRASGGAFQRVSNHGIDRDLSGLTQDQLKAVSAFTYTENGHIFYVLKIAGVRTYVYDASTSQWHTRGPNLNIEWVPSYAVDAFSRNFVLREGNIFELTNDVSSNPSGNIEPIVSANIPTMQPIAIERLGLICASLTPAGAENADYDALAFSFSDDAGRTYSAEEIIDIHEQEQFAQRVQIYRQGQCRAPGRVYRIRGINPDGLTRFMFGPIALNDALH